MRERLVQIDTELSRAYPLKVTEFAKKAWDAIDKLRCELDSRVCIENPGHLEAHRIYWRAGRDD